MSDPGETAAHHARNVRVSGAANPGKAGELPEHGSGHDESSSDRDSGGPVRGGGLARAALRGTDDRQYRFRQGRLRGPGVEGERGLGRRSGIPTEAAKNPGPVARFAANKPDGSLTTTFEEVKNPRTLSLSLDYGWGWGDAGQASDAVSFMLLDASGNGYVFEVHRCKARWAVQWARVANGTPRRGQELGGRGDRRDVTRRSATAAA